MTTKVPTVITVVRGRGRPRLTEPNVRVECMVPRNVYDQLVKVEQSLGPYRTRVASAVLCEWAQATKSGRSTHQILSFLSSHQPAA